MRAFLAVILTMVCVAGAAASAGDWPRWRGPGDNGVSQEPSNWPAGWPPKKLWSANVGAGCSSPIIARGRVFVMGWAADETGRKDRGLDTVYCLDGRTGREAWKQSYPARYQGRFRAGDTGAYGGPLATPVFDESTGYLHTLGVDGDLACWDARDGRKIWAGNLHDQFTVRQRPDVGRGQRDYGFTCSPLVRGDLLMLQVGDEQGTVVALDKRTGQKRWSSEHRGPAGHCGGLAPLRAGGADALAALTLTDLVLMRADDGRTIAAYRRQTDYGCNLPTPAVSDRGIVLTSGYNRSGTEMVDFAGDKPRVLWQSEAHAVVSSPVIAAGRLFLVSDALHCVNLADGKLLWKGGRFGHGSCVATGDGKLIVFGNGRLALIDAKASQYSQLAAVEKLVAGTCYPHVAFAGGLIACKDRDGHLVCLSVAGKAE